MKGGKGVSVTIFDRHLPIDRYDRSQLYQQFMALAAATQGVFVETALNWHFSGSNKVVKEIYWRGFPCSLWIEHDWIVHTSLVIEMSSHLRCEIRFNNVYGGVSGVPIMGPPRVESDLHDQTLIAILPETAYWQLVLAQEPFALTFSRARLALATYRFYPHQFYLEALDYLTAIAERLERAAESPLPVLDAVNRIRLPWST